MAKLEDSKGRTWEIIVSPHEYGRVSDQLGIDLYDVVDKERAPDVIKTLETNDTALAEILWLCCEEEAAGKDVSRIDFIRSLSGKHLNEGYHALLEGLRDFFRRPEQRDLMTKLIEFVRAAEETVAVKIKPHLDEIDAASEGTKFASSLIDSPEKSESTPSQQVDGGAGATP